MAAVASPTFDATAAIRQADNALRLGRLDAADAEIEALARHAPDRVETWLLCARLRKRNGDFFAMLDAARRATSLAPNNATAAIICIEAEIMAGDTAAARQSLAALEQQAAGDPALLRRIAEIHTHLGAHAEADRCAQAALGLRADADGRFQAASCALAMGRLDEAEALLDRVIAERPDDFDAYYNRATLRRQTRARNHVAELSLAAQRLGERAPPALHYALGKELEDLGESERAFDHIALGAAARRKALAYDVQGDIDAMAAIKAAFGPDFFAKSGAGYEEDAPIFVVGLPRSGTTLVDRILSRHPKVESRGELNDLALAVMRAAGRSADKRDRIPRAADADIAALGAGYCRSVRGAGAHGAIFLDKTPLNFLYLGLIARALPHAKIVHLTRHPMASGYAMLKTLFRMGYPFSYDLSDLGRYQSAYLDLMQHWRAMLGARILDVRYEDLIDHQEARDAPPAGHCGLDWHAECLAFNEAPSPSATASAAQVRRPLYRDSLDQWRGLAHRLVPLAAALKARGVAVE